MTVLERYLLTDYHLQPGCHDCGYCFTRWDYDDPPDRYCMASAPTRPSCYSSDEVPYDGSFTWNETRRLGLEAAKAAWEAWAKGRHVDPHGKCSRWMSERRS